MKTAAEQLRDNEERARAAYSDTAADAAVAACPLALTWIAIELVDEDGAGVADAAWRVTLPDGEQRRGLTDADGKARIDGIQPGTCQVCFPDLNEDCWDVATAAPA